MVTMTRAFRLALVGLISVPLRAQQPARPLGFALGSSSRQDSLERRLLAVPDTASARLMSRDLTRVPHVAGTAAQAVTRDYVLDKLRSWGLEAWSREYTVYLPHPDTVVAWLIPAPGAAPLAEPQECLSGSTRS